MGISEQAALCEWQERNSYSYLDGLTKRDWAWEIVRRNPKMTLAWRSARSSIERVEQCGPLMIVRCRDHETPLDRWGLLYSDSPAVDARTACVLWRPDCYAGVLSMSAVVTASDGQKTLLHDLQCRSVLLLRPGDQQHIVLLGEGRGLQLTVQGASVLTPVRLLIDAVPDPNTARIQLDLLRCFQDLRLTGRIRPRRTMKEMENRRLKMVLQALDGSRAGASHREIAIAIYGPDRVRADWDDPREHLKDHIRRTVRRGFSWMSGGYRSFLR